MWGIDQKCLCNVSMQLNVVNFEPINVIHQCDTDKEDVPSQVLKYSLKLFLLFIW